MRSTLLTAALAAAALSVPAAASAAIPTVTEVSCRPSPLVVGDAASCTASVGSPSRPPYPGGTVTFQAVGPKSLVFSEPSCELALLTGGSRCKVSYLATGGYGIHTITATYEGDAEHDPSSGTTTLKVVPPAKKACKKGKKLRKVKGKDGVVRKKCVRVKKKGRKG